MGPTLHARFVPTSTLTRLASLLRPQSSTNNNSAVLTAGLKLQRNIMSMETVATLKRISADDLAKMLREQPAGPSEDSKIAVVDVRDDGM